MLTPAGKPGKGGGLATYVNKRECEFAQIEKFQPNPGPENLSGEFQFLKHRNKCYNNRTNLINVYRYPSKAVESFTNQLDQENRKMSRYYKKHVLFVRDFNFDLIKHSSNANFQKLIDILRLRVSPDSMATISYY